MLAAIGLIVRAALDIVPIPTAFAARANASWRRALRDAATVRGLGLRRDRLFKRPTIDAPRGSNPA